MPPKPPHLQSPVTELTSPLGRLQKPSLRPVMEDRGGGGGGGERGRNGSTATELAHTEGEYFTGRVSRVQDSERDTQRGRLHKDNHYLTSSSLLWNRCFVLKSRRITSDCLPIIVLILWQRKPFRLNLCMLEMRKNPWLWGAKVCCSPSSPCRRHWNRNRQNMETGSEKCLMISTRISA